MTRLAKNTNTMALRSPKNDTNPSVNIMGEDDKAGTCSYPVCIRTKSIGAVTHLSVIELKLSVEQLLPLLVRYYDATKAFSCPYTYAFTNITLMYIVLNRNLIYSCV